MVTTYLCEMSTEKETHYESVIGLEVHVQMNTLSKAYSSDGYSYGGAPNTQVCPISLGHPGTLPKPNVQVVENAIKLGGTTIKDHIQPDGNLGYFKHYLKVYGRTNDKCVECDGKIKEIKQLGRSSFFCGSCQR